jgi:hypothetical protein
MDSDQVRLNGLLDHVRAILTAACYFEPNAQKKTLKRADKLWTEMRDVRNRRVLAERVVCT